MNSKKLKRSFVAIAVMVATILSFVSCDNYSDDFYVKGDRVQIEERDSIIYYDQIIYQDTIIYKDSIIYKEKIIYVETDNLLDFKCYNFNQKGYIEAHTSNHDLREFSYNFQMEATNEVFFDTEQEAGKALFEVSKEVTFNENSIAILYVNSGVEKRSVPVMVPGAYSVIINSEKIFPCDKFTLTAEVKKEEKTKVIKEKEYEVAIVTYKFLNGFGEEVKSSKITLYSPIKEINERTIDLSYEVIDNEVVITGKIENTIDPDTTIVTKVPLELSLKCETKKTVKGNNFNFEVSDNPSDSSKTVVKKFTLKKDGNLTVAYNEIEGVYTHNVSASGNTVTVKQTARYYNEFVAELYGKTLEINLPIEVKTSGYEKLSENESVTEKSQLYNVNYTASQSSLTASAKQEVEIVIEKANESTVSLSYEVVNKNVVVTGKVDNTIAEDEEFSVSIPLTLSLATEERKVVNGTNFDFSAKGNPSSSSSKTVNTLNKKDGNLTVAYNEIEGVYTHNVSASGNTVTVKQTAKYYNGFVATLYGETLEINLPVEVKTADFKKVSENETASEKSQLYNVNYTASQSSLTASAKQEVEIVIAKSSFESETVLFASRTVTFDKLQSPKVYDCVVTSVSTGGHNFKYREVYADGSKSSWTSESLSAANFNYIEEGMKNSNAALAIYNHKKVDGSRVGYLRDFLSIANQIIYFAYGCPQSTFDAINATMFGKLENCILGSAKADDNGVIKMTCSAGYYNGKIISQKETITLY